MQTETTEITNEPFVLPASFAQQRMWFLDRLEGGAIYNVPLATRLRGPLDTVALRQALEVLLARHESLRTAFTMVDGEPHQVIRPPRPVSIEVIDVSDAADAEARAGEVAVRLASRSFDLETDDLLRAALVKLGDDDHLLSLTLHHIITDAWSMTVLGRELRALYSGLVTSTEVKLPELPIQYGDYAVWQQEWMSSGGLDQQLAYWKGRLTGAPALLDLATDHPRPARQSFRGATIRKTLPPVVLEQVRALGQREGATMFMILLAAFAALLSRYSGQEDIVIASPVANRNRAELEGLIGLLVNTLALRVTLEGDPSFTELLRRTREAALGAFSNQELPFERLVEELNPERHLSHAPVAQVMFVQHNVVGAPSTFAGLTEEPVATERGTAKFDLSLFGREVSEGLMMSLEYGSDLFEPATARRMLDHYGGLLQAAVADPARPLSELGLLGDSERELVLRTWNDTAVSDPTERLRPVHELVAEQATRTPEAVAVLDGSEQLTYSQLDVSAEQLARHLRTLGVRPGVAVAIFAERSVATMVAVLAVLKAGGAYAPIDPSYPAERVAFMLDDTATPVIVTQRHLLSRLPPGRPHAVLLDAGDDWASPEPNELPAVGAGLDDLAYVIFTSGSTGRPKGVAMEHRPLANLLAWQLDTWDTLGAPRPAARTLQFASLSFDVGFQELFATWCAGGTLVLIDDESRRDPELLVKHLRQQRVQRLFLPFVALENLCETAEFLALTVPSLREVITAGEQLKSTEAIRAFFAKHPDCRLVNQYGPTESHVVTAFALPDGAEPWPALPPIGRPIANARIYLLDRHRQPVPIRVPGELYIGGISLARGYLNAPELTSERFVADPYSDSPNARMYRTGDLARYLPHGEIEYLGRHDHQLKIRGFRVEPGEVEAALRTHPGVREALVMAREDDATGKRLVAYLIADAASTTAVQLRERLGSTLPEYMIPSAFVFLEEFPLTSNGKVDRARLGAGPLPGEERERRLVAPRNDTEERLAAIWCRVLGVKQIGVHDDFFELGGHSLMAVRLFSEVERKLGVRAPLSALFETATIAGLAEIVERERRRETDWSTMVTLRRGGNGNPLFLIGWAGGEVLPYRDLVENLEPGLSVYGLRAPGVDRRSTPLASVEALAQYYVGEIRRVQPRGPYRLGGFCFSGLVAYEMARLLLTDGEEIDLLALLDAYPYRAPRKRRRLDIERTKLRSLQEADLQGKLAWVRRRGVELVGRVRSTAYLQVGPRIYELLSARNLQHRMPQRPWNHVLVASNLARRNYVPTPLGVRVEFFRAQRAQSADPTPWDTLAGRGVQLRQIVAPDINHDRMMHEPHVRLLAGELTSALRGGAPSSPETATAR